MGAAFLKPLQGSTLPRDGFEFDFPRSAFQMVPIDGERPMSVLTGAEDCLMESSRPGMVRLKDFKGGRVTSDQLGRLILPKGSSIEFSVQGVGVGSTDLVLHDGNGARSHALQVSVKGRLRKTFALFLVRDIRRSTVRTSADAVSIMRDVSALFLEQTNLELVQVGQPQEMLVQKTLGNPILLDKELPNIIRATPPVLADLFVYCVWDVEDSTKPSVHAAGLTGGNRSFVDDGRAVGSDAATQQFAHEVGHALGLDHHTDGSHLMFRAASGGLRLSQLEIDKVNGTGRQP